MDPVVSWIAWAAKQVAGPYIAKRALSDLSKSSWRRRLAEDAIRESGIKERPRRVARWLARRDVQDALVTLDSEAITTLTESLAHSLGSKTLFGRHKVSMLERRERANALVPWIIGQLLVHLDPSTATAVASLRQMERLEAIQEDLRAIREQRFTPLTEQVTAMLPPEVEGHLEDLLNENPPVAERLINTIFHDDRGTGAAVSELIQSPPQWFAGAPHSAWAAVGQLAAALELNSKASTAFERAAEEGAPHRSAWLGRAALEAAVAGEWDRASALIDRARGISPDPFVEIVDAAIRSDQQEVLRLGDTYPRTSIFGSHVVAMMAHACLGLGEWERAIKLCREQRQLSPESTGSLVRLAQALLAGAESGQSPSLYEDANEALDLAVEARDMRRHWGGNSVEAVVVGCQAAIAMRAWERALELAIPFPSGEATDDESSSDEVLKIAAGVAIVLGRIELAQQLTSRIASPAERSLQMAQIKEHQGAEADELRPIYEQALDEGKTLDEKLAALVGLASIGADDLSGLEELRAERPLEADLVEALRELKRGQHANAQRRLRRWADSPRAQDLLGRAYVEAGDLAAAARVWAEAGRRFGSFELTREAVSALARSDQLDEAERLATEALAGTTAGSSRGIELRKILLELAAARGRWEDVERIGRSLLADGPQDSDVRWTLIGSLFNQGKTDESWRVLTDLPGLQPHDEQEARLWLELAGRYAAGDADVRTALDIADRYSSSERVFAAALMTVLTMDRGLELPEPTRARFQSSVDEFLTRYPDSELFQDIKFETPEAFIERVRPLLEPAAEALEEVAANVRDRGFPHVVLSANFGKPYVHALLSRAAGCLPQYGDQASRERDLQSAAEALDHDVVVDLSTLATLSLSPDVWPTVKSAFKGVFIADVAVRDAQLARGTLALRAVGSLAWDTTSQRMMFQEIDSDTADEMASRAEWIAVSAADMAIERVAELTVAPHLDVSSFGAAIGTLEIAKSHGIEMFADDFGLRQLANADGVRSFPSLDLVGLLETRGDLDTDVRARLEFDLMRQYVVDLPLTQSEFIGWIEHDNWGPGPGLFQFARQARWGREDAFETFQRVCRSMYAHEPSHLPNLVALAAHGAALGRPVEAASRIAAVLVTQAISIAQFDPHSFASILNAARSSLTPLNVPDPLVMVVTQVRDALAQRLDPRTSVQVVTALSTELDERDRLEVLRTLLAP